MLGLLLGLVRVLWIVVRAVRVVVRVFKAVTLNRGFNVIVYVLSLGVSVLCISARAFGGGSG